MLHLIYIAFIIKTDIQLFTWIKLLKQVEF